MGMCGDRVPYCCEMLKQVPGTENFAVAKRVPLGTVSPNANVPE